MNKIFITGNIGVGKTTLIKNIIDSIKINDKVYGFYTEKDSFGDKHYDVGRVYIHPAMGMKIKSQKNCIADLTGNKQFTVHTEIFEELGVRLLSNIPSGNVVIMDEIGFLESKAPKFCEKIKEIIDGNYIILGVIKHHDTPILNYIRNNSCTDIFLITPSNRNVVQKKIMGQIRKEY